AAAHGAPCAPAAWLLPFRRRGAAQSPGGSEDWHELLSGPEKRVDPAVWAQARREGRKKATRLFPDPGFHGALIITAATFLVGLADWATGRSIPYPGWVYCVRGALIALMLFSLWLR